MSYRHLSMDERNVIYRMKLLGHGPAEIARCLGRHPGTIGRELKRNAQVIGDSYLFCVDVAGMAP